MHYGKFVAEAKFLAQRKEYSDLIRRQDSQAIMDLLTNKAVEKQVDRTPTCPAPPSHTSFGVFSYLAMCIVALSDLWN